MTKTQVLLILAVVLFIFTMEANARFQLKVSEDGGALPHPAPGTGDLCSVWGVVPSMLRMSSRHSSRWVVISRAFSMNLFQDLLLYRFHWSHSDKYFIWVS